MALVDAPVVAEVVRNGVVESVHHGLAVLTDASGAVIFAAGDPETPVFPRSSTKPLQAVASLRAGTPARDRFLAVACSSHSGEDFHLETVRGLLAQGGLDESALRNTPDLPLDEEERVAWIAAHRDRSSLAQNCSGKHAAMVTAAKAAGWSLDDYLDPEHPLQQLMTEVITELGGAAPSAIATDGCGAPAHQIPLVALARGFGRIAGAAAGPERLIADAMRSHPEQVAGTRRDATALMRAVPGLIAKDGAEAVYAAGLADGRGLAVKIVDGSSRARVAALGELLRIAGVDVDDWSAAAKTVVLGHGQPVGEVRSVRLG